MGKKSIIISIVAIIIVAALVYKSGSYFIKSISKEYDTESEKSNKNSNETTNNASVNKTDNETNNDKNMNISDTFSYFKDKEVNEIISYSNDMFQIQLNVEKDKFSFAKANKLEFTCSLPEQLDASSVFAADFLDEENGIFFIQKDAAAGHIIYDVYITDDAGINWKNITNISIAGSVRGVYMLDKDNYYIISEQNAYCTDVIYTCTDGGKTWNPVENELVARSDGIIYPISDKKDKIFLVTFMGEDDTITDAILFKMDSEWNVKEQSSINVN